MDTQLQQTVVQSAPSSQQSSDTPPSNPPQQKSIADVVVCETSDSSKETDYALLSNIKNVAFFGYADAKPETELYQSAFHAAELLAKNGFTIVDGGGPGVMDAATKGAKSVGGETIAVTFYPKDAPGFEGRYVGNIASKEIVTRNYIERMFKLMEHADCYIIFNGGTGTISELGTAWVMARLYYGHHKPFLLYGDFWVEIIQAIEKNMLMRGNENNVFRIVNSPEEVLQSIRAFDKEMSDINHKNCAICKEKEEEKRKNGTH